MKCLNLQICFKNHNQIANVLNMQINILNPKNIFFLCKAGFLLHVIASNQIVDIRARVFRDSSSNLSRFVNFFFFLLKFDCHSLRVLFWHNRRSTSTAYFFIVTIFLSDMSSEPYFFSKQWMLRYFLYLNQNMVVRLIGDSI